MPKLTNSTCVLFTTDITIFLIGTYFSSYYFNISPDLYTISTILLSLFGIYSLFLRGYYKIRKYNFFLKDAYILLEALLLAFVIPSIILFLLKFDERVFQFLLTDLFVIYLLLLIWRSGFYQYRKKLHPVKNVLIIGAGKSGDEISREILARPELKLNISGFIDNDENKLNTKLNGIDIIGKTADLSNIIAQNDIKIVIVAVIGKIEQQALMDISECIPQGVDIYKMPVIYEKITQKIPVGSITTDWFIYDFTSIERPLYNFLKRIFDITAASVIFVITLPVLIVIGISVKLYDGEPIIYYQNRVGKNNKIFKLYKLRTMHVNADKAGMVANGNTSDNRIIPFCKFVRKARFDEIPQMINIIKGDMSIVGPRAEFYEFVKEYEKKIPFYNRRHWITPGWTGWAQINQGHCVNLNDITEKLRYDFYYIKNRNIFWDISILLKAIGLALSGRHK
jgi:exopolysaccharide biosynthesis polyprenyl glycosylphosphotransferase